MPKGLKIRKLKLVPEKEALGRIPEGKVLINTVNAHSFVTAQTDEAFAEALQSGDYLIPDGISIVKACRWLKCPEAPREKIAGADLFAFEMERLNRKGGTCFFMGSSEKVLAKIREKAQEVYPNIRVETYSPPYKPEFTEEDNAAIIAAINAADPDLLWIGMTAPKQEKWAAPTGIVSIFTATAAPSALCSTSSQARSNAPRSGGWSTTSSGSTGS